MRNPLKASGICLFPSFLKDHHFCAAVLNTAIVIKEAMVSFLLHAVNILMVRNPLITSFLIKQEDMKKIYLPWQLLQ